MVRILHITPHLGGGVGKALSGLIEQARVSKEFEHVIVCLENPDKSQFIDRIQSNGCEVIIQPDAEVLRKLMEDAHVVQLEYWSHQSLTKYLSAISPSICLLTWFHQSGLNQPLPKKLMLASHVFLFTSQCSYENPKLRPLVLRLGTWLGVVCSSGGFQGLPEPRDAAREELSAGYIGTLDFAKLLPEYVKYLAAVDIKGFRVKMIGDSYNQKVLKWQCYNADKPGLLEFTGFVPDIVPELSTINVLAYLLNPKHYGTAENALLEAMSMGIVPVVLNNPAEMCIVEDHKTGLVVHSLEEFAEAIRWLDENPEQRQIMGCQAAASVRMRFSAKKTEAQLNTYYRKVMTMEKKKINFAEVL